LFVKLFFIYFIDFHQNELETGKCHIEGGLLSLPYLERRYGMLTSMRKTHDAAFKANVAFEAAKAVV
jgi:hypothetical protein